MNTISLPSCEILMPRFEIPRFLRNLKDDTLARMMQQRTNSKNIQAGNRGIVLSQGGAAATNPLASVPWVAQWKFNNNGNDSIGANNLTNNNSATFATGKLGGATGATQLVSASSQAWSIADNAALSTGNVDFTVALWVYMDTNNVGVFYGIANKGLATAGKWEWGLYRNDSERFIFGISSNGTSITNFATANNFGAPATATWYCVIAWRDGTANTLNIQVNNGTVNATSTAAAPADSTAVFGVGLINGGNYWNGRIDNVCFAKSAVGGGGALSAAQRTAFYAAGVGTEVIAT